jgi:S-adenosylmethionine uptake transporter
VEVLNRPGSPLRRAVLLAVASEGVLVFMDSIIKSMTTRYPTLEIAFLRFAMGSIFAAAFFMWKRPGLPTWESIRFNALRSGLIVVTAVAFFYALGKLPLAECMALSFVSPLFIALFGVVLLKERFDPRIVVALGCGLIGMFAIVGGQLGASTWSESALYGAIAVLISSITYALVVVILRARATIDPLPTILLFQHVGPSLILAGPAAAVWVQPTPTDLGVFLGVGALGMTGHGLLAKAYSIAEASRLAPVNYVILVWGIVFGVLFFGEWPGLMTFAGALFIVAAAAIAQRR